MSGTMEEARRYRERERATLQRLRRTKGRREHRAALWARSLIAEGVEAHVAEHRARAAYGLEGQT